MKDMKGEIRKRILGLRNAMTEAEVEEKSREVLKAVLGIDSFDVFGTVMCYMDFNNEVKTGEIINLFLSKGKRVAIPAVEKYGKTAKSRIVAYQINSLEEEMQKGAYGILEPVKDISRVVDPKEFELVLVPGVAFDRNGNRIGFGAGYYDKFLCKTRKDCVKAGLAYEYQVLDSIPAEKHDILMDYIITEKGIVKGKGDEK